MKDLKKLRQERAAKVAEGRKMLDVIEAEKRSPKDDKPYQELMADIDARGQEIEAEERQQRIEAELAAPVATIAGERAMTVSTVEATQGKPGSEFRSVGEIVECLFTNKRSDALRGLEARDFSSASGAAGAHLIPQQFVPDIYAMAPEPGIVRPRAMVMGALAGAPDAELIMPALAQGSAGAYGGMSLSWTGEGATMDETSAELEQIKTKPKEITGYCNISNVLLRNAASADPYIRKLLGGALVAAEDYAFLRGDGVGKPLGATNASCRLQVARSSANTILTVDVLAMLVKIHPDLLQRAVWVANITALPKIAILKDEDDANIFLTGRNIQNQLEHRLLGLPLLLTGRTPVLGSEGDLMLVDWGSYLVRDGYGPVLAISEHVEFKANKSVLRIVASVDGQFLAKDPLTLEDGSTQVSPVVVLK